MNNELWFLCFVLYIIPAFIYCERVFISSDLGMEEAGVNGSLGLLDTQDMWQGVAGDKQEAVQGVHTYTLPPEQEVALLLDQPPIISFQQPVIPLQEGLAWI